MKTESGEAEEYTVSFQNLLPSTNYVFRVIAYNVNGISYPAEATEEVLSLYTIYCFRPVSDSTHVVTYPLFIDRDLSCSFQVVTPVNIMTLPLSSDRVLPYSPIATLPARVPNHDLHSSPQIVTPSKVYLSTGYLQSAPFYHQTWFMVTLAAVSIVLIIIVVAALCVKSKTYKYKREQPYFKTSSTSSECNQDYLRLFTVASTVRALYLTLQLWGEVKLGFCY